MYLFDSCGSMFSHQKIFMEACDQSTDVLNKDQFALYTKLVNEEFTELYDATRANDEIETLDAIIDLIVVLIGAGYSCGIDMEEAWKLRKACMTSDQSLSLLSYSDIDRQIARVPNADSPSFDSLLSLFSFFLDYLNNSQKEITEEGMTIIPFMILDTIAIMVDAGISKRADMHGAWCEVMRSNFAKISSDGKVKKREDGKVLKPEGWTPPNLESFVFKK